MFKLSKWIVVLVGIGIGSRSAASAAELRPDLSYSPGTGVVLEGRIEADDFERFQKFILNSGHISQIYLASPGGNLGAALKIGMLVRLLKLSTIVPSKELTHQGLALATARHGLRDNKDYVCASACFFIFVAGIHRSADGNGTAILGLHSPTVSQNGSANLAPEQLNVATDQARRAIEIYFKNMNVPGKYFEEVYAVPKNKIRWIRNDEFASDFAGFIPEFRALANARCKNSSRDDGLTKGKNTSDRESEETCALEIRRELADHAMKDVLRAQSGGMPRSLFEPQAHPN